MQNRNMFLYRRQGPKKRAKPGSPRKNRGSQKGLPNSARDLLPLIQPATKALAQMLAGRTGASGQLGHARAVLAQTERLVSDRAHNRLNPAEREEFFEQVARLKLTLADAESEAEVQAMEEEAVAPAPTPVDRERLKEMAMALTSPGRSTSYDDHHKGEAQKSEATSPTSASEPEATPGDAASEAKAEEPAETSAKPLGDPSQLRLPRNGAERVAIQPDTIRPRTNGRRRAVKPGDTSPRPRVAAEAAPSEADAGSGAETSKAKVSKASPDDAKQKLPKGWIIDDEGFVVPGPAA